jgi:hypothetical protein
MENYIFQPHSLSKSVQRRDFDVLFATQAGFLCALHADAVLAPELHLAGVSSICTHDCVVSLSEMFNNSASFGSGSTVREQLILLSDVVERLLHSANPASGADGCTRFVVDGNVAMFSVHHRQRNGNEGNCSLAFIQRFKATPRFLRCKLNTVGTRSFLHLADDHQS